MWCYYLYMLHGVVDSEKKNANLLGEASQDKGHHTKAPAGGFVIGPDPVRYPKEEQ